MIAHPFVMQEPPSTELMRSRLEDMENLSCVDDGRMVTAMLGITDGQRKVLQTGQPAWAMPYGDRMVTDAYKMRSIDQITMTTDASYRSPRDDNDSHSRLHLGYAPRVNGTCHYGDRSLQAQWAAVFSAYRRPVLLLASDLPFDPADLHLSMHPHRLTVIIPDFCDKGGKKLRGTAAGGNLAAAWLASPPVPGATPIRFDPADLTSPQIGWHGGNVAWVAVNPHLSRESVLSGAESEKRTDLMRTIASLVSEDPRCVPCGDSDRAARWVQAAGQAAEMASTAEKRVREFFEAGTQTERHLHRLDAEEQNLLAQLEVVRRRQRRLHPQIHVAQRNQAVLGTVQVALGARQQQIDALSALPEVIDFDIDGGEALLCGAVLRSAISSPGRNHVEVEAVRVEITSRGALKIFAGQAEAISLNIPSYSLSAATLLSEQVNFTSLIEAVQRAIDIIDGGQMTVQIPFGVDQTAQAASGQRPGFKRPATSTPSAADFLLV